jgi:hypothetical protein
LLAYRELDDTLGLTDTGADNLHRTCGTDLVKARLQMMGPAPRTWKKPQQGYKEGIGLQQITP